MFVEKLEWVTASLYLEFLALSQCLPGPSSTQVSFVLGLVGKGVTGGLISGAPVAIPCCAVVRPLPGQVCSVEKGVFLERRECFSPQKACLTWCSAGQSVGEQCCLFCRHTIPVPGFPHCFPGWRGCSQLPEGPCPLAAWPPVRCVSQALHNKQPYIYDWR